MSTQPFRTGITGRNFISRFLLYYSTANIHDLKGAERARPGQHRTVQYHLGTEVQSELRVQPIPLNMHFARLFNSDFYCVVSSARAAILQQRQTPHDLDSEKEGSL